MNPNDSLNDLDPAQLALVEAVVKQHRARERFDRRHGEGSAKRVRDMAGRTLTEIGEAFDLTGERMGVLWRDMFGVPYADYLKSQGIKVAGKREI